MSNDQDFKIPDDWRGKTLTKIRKLFHQADPDITEEVKYRTASNPNGVLVWYRHGMISTGEVYAKHLRLTLAKGPQLKDQDRTGLINSYRAIIIKEDDSLDEVAFVNLIRAAVAFNAQSQK